MSPDPRRPMSVDNPNTYEARTLKKAEAGDADAQNWIGDMYGRHGFKALSEEWYRKAKASAIQQGNPFAQNLAEEALRSIDFAQSPTALQIPRPSSDQVWRDPLTIFNEQRLEREKAAEREAEEARQKWEAREQEARVRAAREQEAVREQEVARVKAARQQEAREKAARKQAALYIKQAALYILLAIPVFVFLTIFIILKFNPELFNYFYPGLKERLSKLENAYALRYPNLPKP